MTALRAHEQYVHQSQLCIVKTQNIEGPGFKNTTMRRNSIFVYNLLRLMMIAHIEEFKILSEYSNNSLSAKQGQFLCKQFGLLQGY